MFFHLKTVIAILIVTGGIGVAVNEMRSTTKIRPSAFVSTTKPIPTTSAGVTTATSQPVDPNTILLDDVVKAYQSGLSYIIDARKPEAYAKGHIKNAINLPSTAIFENIDFVIRNVPSTELVIVYCDGGNCEASHTVADALRNQFGFVNVKVYVKGWEELEKSPHFAEMAEVSP